MPKERHTAVNLSFHRIERVQITEATRYERESGGDFEAASLIIETDEGTYRIGLHSNDLGTLKPYDTDDKP